MASNTSGTDDESEIPEGCANLDVIRPSKASCAYLDLEIANVDLNVDLKRQSVASCAYLDLEQRTEEIANVDLIRPSKASCANLDVIQHTEEILPYTEGSLLKGCANLDVIQHTEGCLLKGNPYPTPETSVTQPISVSMNPHIYRAAVRGNLSSFKRASEDLELSLLKQVSPQGSTVLHIAAGFGHERLVAFILQQSADLFKAQNDVGDLALHMAASAGYLSIVRCLVGFAQESFGSSFVSKLNKESNTALHVALRNRHEKMACFLFEADPEASFVLNQDGESALFLAIEAGYLKLVQRMMERTPKEIEEGKSLVHAAVDARNKRIVDAILSKKPNLINSPDKNGRFPLYYAADKGYVDMVRKLLDKSSVSAYRMDRNGFYPIHAASSRGHVAVVQEFLQRYPDSWELLTSEDHNILHVAAEYGRAKLVKYLLGIPELGKLINERDRDGNTPLHLAAIKAYPKVVNILAWNKRVKLEMLTRGGLTALDLAEARTETILPFRERLTWSALKSAGAPRGDCKKLQHSVGTSSSHFEPYKARTNTLMVVATLVVTATYATGFGMPGGNNSSEPNLGKAIFVREKVFHMFVICNTISLYSSIAATIILIFAELEDLNLLLTSLKLAMPLLGVALTMMSLTFVAGVYLVVSNLRWLALFILVGGSTFTAALLLLFIQLCAPLSSKNRALRYLFYHTFCLMIWATGSDLDKIDATN